MQSARVCAMQGMRFAYHNHNIEAQKYDDIVAFDEVLRLTDPAVVGMEFDIGNFIAGGGDPYPYLEKYPHRFELAHVKEWATPFTPTVTSNFPKYAPFGQGTTDWKKTARCAEKGWREANLHRARWDCERATNWGPSGRHISSCSRSETDFPPRILNCGNPAI